ncbi:E3 ubiquitin-protein ligase RING2 [Phytophthora pseudosyringae]|uniref:RING-type E3 ubiquitin transferase n=1 Tax=Phytophthora pseudosyringae TaxID=221518 RepID=A0A8T1W9N0_9STRA|nr:E3 ubiquitin-protein ligase RING2 [Phytophthora pseudosyringae]
MAPPQNPYTFTREDYDNLVASTVNCQVSRRSKYEEIELVDDCTLFDIYRQPRAPVTDPSATKTLPVRQLNADLTCPICLGIIKETMVVMECLHRFCGECISTAIRQSKRECPSCRIHIPSKRSLRSDANFDALIRKIHPNLAEFERNEDQIIEQLNRSRHFNNAYTESTRMGVLSQAASRRHGRKKAEGSASASSSRPSSPSNGASPPVGEKRSSLGGGSPSDNASSSAAVSEDESARKKPKVAATAAAASTTGTSPTAKPATEAVTDRVNFRVLLHEEEQPNAPKLERTLFTTSAKLKVRHLKKHLAALLRLDTYDNMCIVLPTVNCTLSGLSESVKARKSSGVAIRQDLQCDQELEDFVTLQDIYEQYGMDTAWELRLLYHFSPGTIVNGIARFVAATSNSAWSTAVAMGTLSLSSVCCDLRLCYGRCQVPAFVVATPDCFRLAFTLTEFTNRLSGPIFEA